MFEKAYEECRLCPRECRVNRKEGQTGFCQMDGTLRVARAALHMWEEPCISGKRGSGAVFFSGCNLRCVYCQNFDIAAGTRGKEISRERLSEIFLELQAQGAANINLVTGAHYVPQIIKALNLARMQGMDLPVVYNSSGYEKLETLKLLEGYVDIYLPDFKYMEPDLAQKFSHAPDYVERAKAAIKEMVRQSGSCQFGEDGYIRRGTIVRHLILPGHTRNSRKVLRYLHETYGEEIYISIMNQYTPLPQCGEYPELSRRVTEAEYDAVVDYAIELGIENGFIQEGDVAEESFIPEFDGEGIVRKDVDR